MTPMSARENQDARIEYLTRVIETFTKSGGDAQVLMAEHSVRLEYLAKANAENTEAIKKLAESVAALGLMTAGWKGAGWVILAMVSTLSSTLTAAIMHFFGAKL